MDINDRLERDIKELLGETIKSSEEKASQMWSALANVDWLHPDFDEAGGYSFRTAGSLIAEIRGESDPAPNSWGGVTDYNYMKWYCSGPYATVEEWVADGLATRGWTYKECGEWD